MARIRLDELTPCAHVSDYLVAYAQFHKLFSFFRREIQGSIWRLTNRLEVIANNVVNKTKSKQELIDAIKELKAAKYYYKQIKNVQYIRNYAAENPIA